MHTRFLAPTLAGALFILQGCSAFGIATRNDLALQREHQANQHRSMMVSLKGVQAQMAQSASKLETIRKELRVVMDREMSQARSQRKSIGDSVAQVQNRLSGVESTVSRVDSGLRQELSGVQEEVTGMQSTVETISGSVDGIRSQTALARSQSATALQSLYRSLLRQREQLTQQLEALENELLEWERRGLLGDGTLSR